MSEPRCGVCGAAASSCCCQHPLHAGEDLINNHSGRAFSIFPVAVHHYEHPPAGSLHEFQFFGHDDNESVAWLFDDDPPPTVGDDRRSPVDPFGPRHHPGNGLTFEVSLGRGEVDARLGLGGAAGHMTAAASATIGLPLRKAYENNNYKMSFCESTFTDAASSRLKEPIPVDDQLQRQADPSMAREAILMRYKEKRKRRCYEMQIRYASRKAYAGAKVPEASAPRQPTLATTCYDPSRLNLGHWFH